MPLNTLQKFTDIFVETGTFWGNGIQTALNAGYKQVISIEIYQKYFDIGTQRFRNNPNVRIVSGDSAIVLGEVIKNISEPITFWLDGHCSGEGTGMGIKEYPLLEELEHIKKHPIKNHVIMIDDVVLWKNYDKDLNLESVCKKIQEINPLYSFYTMDGRSETEILPDYILVAKLD